MCVSEFMVMCILPQVICIYVYVLLLWLCVCNVLLWWLL